jgi:hypothetical protein
LVNCHYYVGWEEAGLGKGARRNLDGKYKIEWGLVGDCRTARRNTGPRWEARGDGPAAVGTVLTGDLSRPDFRYGNISHA